MGRIKPLVRIVSPRLPCAKARTIANCKRKSSQARRKQLLQQHDSLTHHLNAELTAHDDQARPRDLPQRLEDLLFQLAVLPSAQRGLLGDLQHLVVGGDGAALVTGASPTGRPACECRKNGTYKCDCARFYTDATADWGWDSYREVYYFGHTYYQHVISSQGHDLPVHVTLGPASESDFTLSLKSLDRLRKTLREHRLDCVRGSHLAVGLHELGASLVVRRRIDGLARAGAVHAIELVHRVAPLLVERRARGAAD